jgi:hypothetical protein
MAAILTKDLTTGAVGGAGVFDQLMVSVDAHLSREFKANRIKGTDYAQVYVGSMTAAMQNAVQFLLGKQAADKQAELLASQTLTEAYTLSDLLPAQIDKLAAEIALLGQKKSTEEAQIKDIVDDLAVVGVIGKQKLLYGKQTDGFDRDAEQKAAKMMIDTWAIRVSAGASEGVVPTNMGGSQSNIRLAVDDMLRGIGVDPDTTVLPDPPTS